VSPGWTSRRLIVRLSQRRVGIVSFFADATQRLLGHPNKKIYPGRLLRIPT
jgi:hypothetical protein